MEPPFRPEEPMFFDNGFAVNYWPMAPFSPEQGTYFYAQPQVFSPRMTRSPPVRPRQLVEPKPVEKTNLTFKFIDREEDLAEAFADIGNQSAIALDCEGVELGRKGVLCLLQIATADQVYLFDVLALKSSLFSQGLKDILERPVPNKLIYDCRRDSDILYHQFGIRLKGVLDVALTEVFYRYKNTLGNPRYLKGYKRCVEDYLIVQNPKFFETKLKVATQMSEMGTNFWEMRPLPQEVLEYAAYDVFYLRELHFALTQFMSKKNLRLIYGASVKFIIMERDNEESLYERSSPMWAMVNPTQLFAIKC